MQDVWCETNKNPEVEIAKGSVGDKKCSSNVPNFSWDVGSMARRSNGQGRRKLSPQKIFSVYQDGVTSYFRRLYMGVTVFQEIIHRKKQHRRTIDNDYGMYHFMFESSKFSYR